MLLGAVLLWALNITVTKYMFEHGWLPLAYATIRYFAAIAIFWVYTWWREGSFRIARADRKYVGIAAAAIFVNQVCFVYSLEFAKASTVSLLFGSCPMFIGLFSILFRQADVQRAFWIGAGVTFVGVAFIAAGAGGGLVSGWKGDLLAIALDQRCELNQTAANAFTDRPLPLEPKWKASIVKSPSSALAMYSA